MEAVSGRYKRVRNADLKSTAPANDMTGTIGESALIVMFPALPITTVSSRFPNA